MAMFRVRNLLVHVLPKEVCETDSCGIDSGGGGGGCDVSDCGDTGGCDLDSGGCDLDSGGCDLDSGGCDAGSACPQESGCDADSPCPQGSGCDANSPCPQASGCNAPDTPCNSPDSGACDNVITPCGMGMRTHECDLVPESRCAGISQCLPLQHDSDCLPPVITENCQPGTGSGCDVLVANTICLPNSPIFCKVAFSPLQCPPDITNPQCQGLSKIIVAAQPAALCFRSDEPKLNPNSLVELGIMRRQLTAYLKLIQTRERALSRALTPKTAQQIQAAEAVLNGALRHLQTRKQFIQAQAAKKAKGTGTASKQERQTGKTISKKKGRRKK